MTTALDEGKVERFADSLLAGMNQAALMLMVSIGHRTRLFDTMDGLLPASSAEIAAAAGLDERYVREWLAAMVTGGIVTYDSDRAHYQLPAEHAAVLTRAAAPNNIAPFAQYISVLGAVEDNVVSAFEHGCGVPYDRYTRFHQVMAEDSEQTVVAALEPHLLPLVPELRALLERGATALDVGCGSGMALVELGRLFPRSSFRGYDLSWEAVVRARRGASAAGLRNVTFELRDCAELGNDPAEVGRYDVVFAFDAVHDQARPDRLLQGIHRVLRSDGIFLMQDIKASSSLENNFDHPAATLLYTISCMHCMSVSLAQQDGIGLGAMWGKETALRMLEEAGFGDVATRELAHDFQNLYYVCRPRPAVRAVRRQPNSEAAASL